jgi:hypothetical protein
VPDRLVENEGRGRGPDHGEVYRERGDLDQIGQERRLDELQTERSHVSSECQRVHRECVYGVVGAKARTRGEGWGRVGAYPARRDAVLAEGPTLRLRVRIIPECLGVDRRDSRPARWLCRAWLWRFRWD